MIITRANFGCGSSREHAPWALETNGIHLVIAESFARIFKQNMFNCGMMAIELPAETLDEIFSTYAGTETHVITQLDKNLFILKNKNAYSYRFIFPVRIQPGPGHGRRMGGVCGSALLTGPYRQLFPGPDSSFPQKNNFIA